MIKCEKGKIICNLGRKGLISIEYFHICKLRGTCEVGEGSGLLMLRHAEDSCAGERSLYAPAFASPGVITPSTCGRLLSSSHPLPLDKYLTTLLVDPTNPCKAWLAFYFWQKNDQ